MENITPNINPASYFNDISNPTHKQYLALRMFFAEGQTAEQVAATYGYTVSTVYSLVRDFRAKIAIGGNDPFFKEIKAGRKKIDQEGEVKSLIIAYRKKYLSVPEI